MWRGQTSLGLPVAYLLMLVIIHVPGAVAHAVAPGWLPDDEATATGMFFTAFGIVSFVVGVRLSVGSTTVRLPDNQLYLDYAKFCLIGGWSVVYAAAPLTKVP